jgi:hypothetical protein
MLLLETIEMGASFFQNGRPVVLDDRNLPRTKLYGYPRNSVCYITIAIAPSPDPLRLAKDE